jgi:hypothetical protein
MKGRKALETGKTMLCEKEEQRVPVLIRINSTQSFGAPDVMYFRSEK